MQAEIDQVLDRESTARSSTIMPSQSPRQESLAAGREW
jgi:hypothetical protein